MKQNIESQLSDPTIQQHPALRPGHKLRQDTEAMLLDIAYVLALARRVRDSILEDEELEETLTV